MELIWKPKKLLFWTNLILHSNFYLQTELQDWLRNECGTVVLVHLDQTLSYFWTITKLNLGVTLEEYSGPGKVRQRHYSACLEDGLQTALNLLKDKPLGI